MSQVRRCSIVNHEPSLIVCHTLEDVRNAHREYMRARKFKLSFAQCVFQGNQGAKNVLQKRVSDR